MKKFIKWLAKVFKVNLTVEKIIYKDKIVEVIKEVPKEVIKEVIKEVPVEVTKEVIKEVIKEVPVYKETKYIALKDEVTGDTYVEGNLYVTGNIHVAGNISSHGGIYYGMSTEEVRMQSEKEISAYKAMEG